MLMLGKAHGLVCHLVTLETILMEINCIAEFEHVPWKPGKKTHLNNSRLLEM